MDVLIVYGTTEGQTRKIAERTAMRVGEHGHWVELYDSASSATNLDVSIFHAIIVATSVHQECHQDTIIDFAVAHRDQLSSKPTAFISVSLSAVLESEKREAQKYVDRFVATTCWQPQKIRPALHRIRLLSRADRQIHRYEGQPRCEQRARSRVH
ncbi:MAG: flavodoxin domain-containing protein [Methyloceanibacter sp.]